MFLFAELIVKEFLTNREKKFEKYLCIDKFGRGMSFE